MGIGAKRNPNVVKRPTTAGVMSTLSSKEQSRDRLASNRVLKANAMHKQSKLKYIFMHQRKVQNGRFKFKSELNSDVQVQISEHDYQSEPYKLPSVNNNEEDHIEPIGEKSPDQEARDATARSERIRFETMTPLPEPISEEAYLNVNLNELQKKSDRENHLYAAKETSRSSLQVDSHQENTFVKLPSHASSNLAQPHSVGTPKEEESKSLFASVKSLPHVDWAYTPLCVAFLNGHPDFNTEGDIRYFTPSEVEDVVQMIKVKYNHFKRTDAMVPFYRKAMATLMFLLSEQQMTAMIFKFQKMYEQVTIENTLKLLLRCKLAFAARKALIETFEAVKSY